jgi:hypothetical protein
MKTSTLPVCIILFLLAALLAGCGSLQMELIQTTPTPSADTASARAEETGWAIYQSADFGLAFQYPSTWQKPLERWHTEEGKDRWIVVTITSAPPTHWDSPDMPFYPKNTYKIDIMYKENASHAQIAELADADRQIKAYLGLTLIQDGESALVGKEYCTRLSAVTQGDFHGLEYIDTVPANGEAGYWWTHDTVLVDSQTRVITITGQPLSTMGLPTGNWRDLHRAEDEKYKEIYQRVVNSISIGR